MTNQPIGIFDSGVGGLSVLAELQKLMPNEHFIYFGDSANVPYGEKTPEQLIEFSKNILDWFKTKNVKMAIMACNTSSAVTLPLVKDNYDFDVIGLIEPISKHLQSEPSRRIGVLATNATIKSDVYKKTIQKYSDKEVLQVACPGWVELVEQDQTHSREGKALVSKYVSPLIEQGAEKIILGCTHYPFLSNIINEVVGKDILLNPAEYLAIEASNAINETSSTAGKVDFNTSKNPLEFVEQGKKLYPEIQAASLLELN